MRITQSGVFRKRVRRLHQREKSILDGQIRKILKDPSAGQEKKGDLKGVFVHKFKIDSTQYLLAYRITKDNLELIMIGPHENYYRDLSGFLGGR
ncbi:MAG: type II toxin-antitoxin system RelE/ParE family toxin [Acidobacteria bacterium]|nr:MAG: type II toxin-antitoxin system RelE/ParE family toxin [Acidobacteriota bacterium]